MSRLPGCRSDLDDAISDLGHLQLEEPLDQARVGPGDHDLGPFACLADFDYVSLEPGIVLVVLERHLFGLRQQRLNLAQVEQGVTVIALLDDPGDYVAFSTGVLLVLEVAFGLSNPLEDDLLGRLCCDPAEVFGGVVPLAYDVAVLIELLPIDPDLPQSGSMVTTASSAAPGMRLYAATRALASASRRTSTLMPLSFAICWSASRKAKLSFIAPPLRPAPLRQ